MSKRDEVFEYVAKYLAENRGRSPSYREIMANCHLSTPSLVEYHINVLVTEGRLEQSEGKRGLSLPNSRLIVEEEA